MTVLTVLIVLEPLITRIMHVLRIVVLILVDKLPVLALECHVRRVGVLMIEPLHVESPIWVEVRDGLHAGMSGSW